MAIILRKKPKPQPPRTLAELIERLAADKSITEIRRRDLVSACSSVARLVGYPLGQIKTEAPAMRDVLTSLHPVQGRISKKRLSNIKSDIAAALTHTGALPAFDAEIQLSEAWEAFLAKATEKYQRWNLARFSRFCTTRKIEPDAVDDAVIKRFGDYLEARIVTHDPKSTTKAAAKAFNAIVVRSGLSIARLTTSRGATYVTPALDSYPPSLQDDIATYIGRLKEPDLFADAGPDRPLRPTSLRNIEAHLRQTLDAAVRAGFSPDHFKTLADLVDLQVLDRALSQMLERFGSKTPTSLPNILGTLVAIAKYHLHCPPETLAKLRKARKSFAERLGANSPRMSRKAERRLEQFDIPRNIGLLANLPHALIARANMQPGTQKATMDATCAAAVAILLSCPMRAENLSALELGADIQPVHEGKKVHFLIHIAPEKVKNREAINAIIESEYASVVNAYLQKHRKNTCGDPGSWLFPRKSGGPRPPAHFAEMIKQTIWRETGLEVHVHLFRHIAAKLYLEAHPGDYESTRRLLGHKKIDTTTKVYSPLSNRAAFERFNKILEDRRGERL
jgi:integrase